MADVLAQRTAQAPRDAIDDALGNATDVPTHARAIDRGTITAEAGAVHRRIAVSELARYQRGSTSRRRSALAELAEDIDENTPPDEPVSTR